MNPLSFDIALYRVLVGLHLMLADKNRKYGNSALDPIRVFSTADWDEQINVRMDDKLSRLRSAQGDDAEDAETDLLGYLILKRVGKAIRHGEAPTD